MGLILTQVILSILVILLFKYYFGAKTDTLIKIYIFTTISNLLIVYLYLDNPIMAMLSGLTIGVFNYEIYSVLENK